jgi:hypothetical protein
VQPPGALDIDACNPDVPDANESHGTFKNAVKVRCMEAQACSLHGLNKLVDKDVGDQILYD